MSKTHEPINYLDRILNEEETRSLSTNSTFQWRNYSISRSGRFKSKNKKREIVDSNIFDKSKTDDAVTVGSGGHYLNGASLTENDKHSIHSSHAAAATAFNKSTTSTRGVRDKVETIKSYYETNL